MSWVDIVEQKYPIQGTLATYSPILYVSDLQQAKLFYEKFFIDFPKFTLRNNECSVMFLRMHYRYCLL